MFTCTSCKFRSKYRNDFRRHIVSDKHRDLCHEANVCHLCLKQFQTKSGYSKHVRKCNANICSVKQKRKDRGIHLDLSKMNRFRRAICEEFIRNGPDIAKMGEHFDNIVLRKVKERNNRIEIWNDDPIQLEKRKEEVYSRPLRDRALAEIMVEMLATDIKKISMHHEIVNVYGEPDNYVIRNNGIIEKIEKFTDMVSASGTFKLGLIKIPVGFNAQVQMKLYYPEYYQRLEKQSVEKEDSYNNVIHRSKIR
jgi:hypothetical protein